VEVRTAERGDKRRILELAERNAILALDQEKLKNERKRQQRVEALDGLQDALGSTCCPLRIECFDISNLMGTHTVASMVVFEGGAPKKSDYRRFTIRGLTEGVPGRLRRHGGGPLAAHEAVGGPAGPVPARPQPQRVVRHAAEHRGHRRRPGAARRRHAAPRGFVNRGVAGHLAGQADRGGLRPGRPDPILLDHDTPELQLLQRVRDEAHRFAITHHRQRRDKSMLNSVLDELPGVGPARKRTLLQHFGSPEAVLAASRDELEGVPGPAGQDRAGPVRLPAPDLVRLTRGYPGSPMAPASHSRTSSSSAGSPGRGSPPR
jgi:excinuclease ABC subunit C